MNAKYIIGLGLSLLMLDFWIKGKTPTATQVTSPVYSVTPGSSGVIETYTNSAGTAEIDIDQVITSGSSQGFSYSVFVYDVTQDLLINIFSDTITHTDQAYTQYVSGPSGVQYAISMTPNVNGTATTIAVTMGGATPTILIQQTLNYQGGLA